MLLKVVIHGPYPRFVDGTAVHPAWEWFGTMAGNLWDELGILSLDPCLPTTERGSTQDSWDPIVGHTIIIAFGTFPMLLLKASLGGCRGSLLDI